MMRSGDSRTPAWGLFTGGVIVGSIVAAGGILIAVKYTRGALELPSVGFDDREKTPEEFKRFGSRTSGGAQRRRPPRCVSCWCNCVGTQSVPISFLR